MKCLRDSADTEDNRHQKVGNTMSMQLSPANSCKRQPPLTQIEDPLQKGFSATFLLDKRSSINLQKLDKNIINAAMKYKNSIEYINNKCRQNQAIENNNPNTRSDGNITKTNSSENIAIIHKHSAPQIVNDDGKTTPIDVIVTMIQSTSEREMINGGEEVIL